MLFLTIVLTGIESLGFILLFTSVFRLLHTIMLAFGLINPLNC